MLCGRNQTVAELYSAIAAGHVITVACEFTTLTRARCHGRNGGTRGAVQCHMLLWPIIYLPTAHRRTRRSRTTWMNLRNPLSLLLMQPWRGIVRMQMQLRKQKLPIHLPPSLMTRPSQSARTWGSLRWFSTRVSSDTTLSVVGTASRWQTWCRRRWCWQRQ